jgi:hypothetical protein
MSIERSVRPTEAPKQMYGVNELFTGKWNGTPIHVYEVGFCEKQFGTSTNSKSHWVWGADLAKSEKVARQHKGEIPDIQTIEEIFVPFLNANPEELAKVEGKTCYIYCDKSKAIDGVFTGENGERLSVHIGKHIATFSVGNSDESGRYNITDICADPAQPVELVVVVNKAVMPPAALIRQEKTDETEA